jgi:hypothetical protein
VIWGRSLSCSALIELPNGHRDLLPEALKHLPHSGATRVASNLALIRTELTRQDVEGVFTVYGGRYAVGARAIWNVFPEFRNAFLCEIESVTPTGMLRTRTTVGKVACGDKIRGGLVFFTQNLRIGECR